MRGPRPTHSDDQGALVYVVLLQADGDGVASPTCWSCACRPLRHRAGGCVGQSQATTRKRRRCWELSYCCRFGGTLRRLSPRTVGDGKGSSSPGLCRASHARVQLWGLPGSFCAYRLGSTRRGCRRAVREKRLLFLAIGGLEDIAHVDLLHFGAEGAARELAELSAEEGLHL